ncbi:oligosaccharyl transferase glycoprotein complex, beta subunit [Friedmanniomyces endolithicus]|uniref:Dolichyl-diphosphooligosaccharide--protein glycosyltransferase subunit WBP1 n=1 Tax=Friedmanniomyces endolithicus TaxID=329885 RepID=A0AAN6J809_9PEZI|nr:oligosaccharyl transferase glycoprotein complex, beta subunit [Friedmanniomyces endolithicus]KAK0294960.1 oligosaccharyl transferase glycoprotein complex, beta subunit [Friedmanniomyces endolithicus]KAK0319814.1 oligosaccharyl transferase glycoprotein complex, beta subunit [Friedmanniomyces endolithicus]KAK0990612.1 oligosaccharyl transferase glycoprotein complex, beta subunit [Friedmanniomyces endolithicus]
MRLRLFGLALGLLGFVSALSAQGQNLLVVIENESEKTKYSQFWSDLQDRGFQLSYRSPKDTTLSLFLHGEPAYSHLLLLPTKSKGFGPNLTPNLIVDFVNGGSNVLLALSAEQGIPSAVSSLLLELDISLPPDRNSLVVDHFNYDTQSAGEKHDVLLLPSSATSKKAIKNFFSVDGLVAFPHAVGQVLGNASPLLASVIKAPATAYTYNPKEDSTEGLEDVFATGAQLTLVSAFQARNSARFTVLGSSAALEDKWFDASVSLPGSTSGKSGQKTANKAFAHALSAWTFKELGVLRVNSVTHRLAEDTRAGITNSTAVSAAPGDVNPEIYRVKNRVHYAVSLSEYSGTHWIPFNPPAGDAVQLEFSMLSPFHRLDLTPSPDATNPQDNATLYTAEFVLPDQHGIFNFFLEYRRPFYTNVEEKRTVSVRHFAHDEWPRSFVISAAFPWIGGIWVTVVGWLGFVGLWVYSKPGGARRELKVGGVGGKK